MVEKTWTIHVCPYCGQQYPGPHGYSMAGDNLATGCFHRHPGERGISQPRLVRIVVKAVEPFVPRPVPHDSDFIPAAPTEDERG